MDTLERDLVYSKSLALIEKTLKRLERINADDFPTPASEQARLLLISAVKMLRESARPPPFSNAELLYNTLILLQDMCAAVEASSSAHISWPLVSYCDHIWQRLFPANGEGIFYSLTTAHNYNISSFSGQLKEKLHGLLLKEDIDKLGQGHQLYCLRLASLEEENLPLYANIGHEFGHAIFWSAQAQIIQLLREELGETSRQLLAALGPAANQRLVKRAEYLVMLIATEAFCDLIGARIAGPAFLLSLHEMSWRSNTGTWNLKLHPDHSRTQAYPSFCFRLHCLKDRLRLPDFTAQITDAFSKTPFTAKLLPKIASYPASIASDHVGDHVSVQPATDPDAMVFETAFSKCLPAFKADLERFLQRCDREFLPARMAGEEFTPATCEDITALLERLDNNILPNVIPQAGTLLGRPASFAAILNATAFFRIHLLLHRDPGQPLAEYTQEVEKIERLTAKALEVSYIQREYHKWREQQPAP